MRQNKATEATANSHSSKLIQTIITISAVSVRTNFPQKCPH